VLETSAVYIFKVDGTSEVELMVMQCVSVNPGVIFVELNNAVARSFFSEMLPAVHVLPSLVVVPLNAAVEAPHTRKPLMTIATGIESAPITLDADRDLSLVLSDMIST
jgi:hypothetical protein